MLRAQRTGGGWRRNPATGCPTGPARKLNELGLLRLLLLRLLVHTAARIFVTGRLLVHAAAGVFAASRLRLLVHAATGIFATLRHGRVSRQRQSKDSRSE